MFEICYIFTVAGLFIALSIVLTIDLLFFGMTLYAAAMYDELIVRVNTIDKTCNEITGRRRALIKCIQLHINILRLIKK